MGERIRKSRPKAGGAEASGGRAGGRHAPKSGPQPAGAGPPGPMHRSGAPFGLAGPVQRKVVIGRSGDRYEREADAVADHVVAGRPAPAISPLPAGGLGPVAQRQSEEEPAEEPVQEAPVQRQAEEEPEPEAAVQRQEETEAPEEEPSEEPVQETPVQRQEEEEPEPETAVQQQEEEEPEEPVQAKGRGGAPGAMRQAAARAIRTKGAGDPLQSELQQQLESGTGRDLSDVRVHTDGGAREAARTMKARAFTHGKDIWLGPGASQNDTRLMAHEATHVVQQTAPRARSDAGGAPVGPAQAPAAGAVQRAPAAAGAKAPGPKAAEPAGAEKPEEVAPGVMDLRSGEEKLPASIDEWLTKRKKGKINVRYGQLGERALEVRKTRDGFSLEKQAIPVRHPLFSRIQEADPNLTPSLVVQKSRRGKLEGYLGLQGAKLPGSKDVLTAQIAKAPELIGLPGVDLGRLPRITNKLEAGQLHLGLTDVPVKLGGAFDGKFSIEAVGDHVAFSGSAAVAVQGLLSGTMTLARSPEGLVTGKANVALDLPKNFSGSVDVAWDGRAVTGEGKVGYRGEKLSGEVTLRLMEKSRAAQLEKEKKAPPEEQKPPAPAEQQSAKKPARKPKKVDYVVFGEGDLTFAFTDWLNGTAHVIVDPKGFVTIIGKITPQKEFELFPPTPYNKQLAKPEARVGYGLPVVGNIFIFANLSLDAFAMLGPAKFYNIVVEGTYSTDPEKNKDFSIRGSFNISAAAGLRLRGEAGAGLEILSHDIKAGAGINALAGIKGYAEATPIIGYREKQGEEGEDKRGEFFVRGEMEIAAQPFLGLSGDLFIELDSPWWSPAPDKRWPWPLGEKEWPLGGSFGIGASVDYVFGSGKAPKLDFKKVDFSAEKFMSDLYHDKARAKSGEAPAKPGTWKEKNAKSAEPPSKGGPAGGAEAGKAPALPPARPRIGPKQKGRSALPNARTAEGKTVRELQKEAARRKPKPGAAVPKGAEAKAKKARALELKKGLAALEAVTARYAQDGASREEVVGGVKSVRRKFRVFKSITVVDGGATWDYEYTINPTLKKKGPPKAGRRDLGKARKAFGQRLFTRSELQDELGVSKATAVRRIQEWSDQRLLFRLASNTFDKFTQYSFDRKKAGQRETSPNNRSKYGYSNPPKDSSVGLEILSKGLRPDSPKPVRKSEATYHKTLARYDSQRPGSSFEDFGYPPAILGHKEPPVGRYEGASGHWNAAGHKQSKAQNRAWNKNPNNYWGPEHEVESARSGSKSPRYRVPSKAVGSHDDWL